MVPDTQCQRSPTLKYLRRVATVRCEHERQDSVTKQGRRLHALLNGKNWRHQFISSTLNVNVRSPSLCLISSIYTHLNAFNLPWSQKLFMFLFCAARFGHLVFVHFLYALTVKWLNTFSDFADLRRGPRIIGALECKLPLTLRFSAKVRLFIGRYSFLVLAISPDVYFSRWWLLISYHSPWKHQAIANVSNEMFSNLFSPNRAKTEFLIFGRPQQLSKLNELIIFIYLTLSYSRLLILLALLVLSLIRLTHLLHQSFPL